MAFFCYITLPFHLRPTECTRSNGFFPRSSHSAHFHSTYLAQTPSVTLLARHLFYILFLSLHALPFLSLSTSTSISTIHPTGHHPSNPGTLPPLPLVLCSHNQNTGSRLPTSFAR